jgi:hypothetical protein
MCAPSPPSRYRKCEPMSAPSHQHPGAACGSWACDAMAVTKRDSGEWCMQVPNATRDGEMTSEGKGRVG